MCGEMWSCNVRASNSCSPVATETASRSLRAPSPIKPAQTFEARIFSAEMQIETHGRRVVIDRGRVHLQCAHVFAPGLRADVSDFCARTGDEIVHAASEAGRLFDHRN